MNELNTTEPVELKGEGSDPAIIINPKNYKFRIEEKSRGRMRITINLNKNEAGAYNELLIRAKPENINNADFAKAIFIAGIQALQQQILSKFAEMEEHIKGSPEARKELEEQGFVFDANGNLVGHKDDSEEGTEIVEPEVEVIENGEQENKAE